MPLLLHALTEAAAKRHEMQGSETSLKVVSNHRETHRWENGTSVKEETQPKKRTRY